MVFGEVSATWFSAKWPYTYTASTIPTRDTTEFGEAERRGWSLCGCGHAFPINGHAFHFQVLGLRLRIQNNLKNMFFARKIRTNCQLPETSPILSVSMADKNIENRQVLFLGLFDIYLSLISADSLTFGRISVVSAAFPQFPRNSAVSANYNSWILRASTDGHSLDQYIYTVPKPKDPWFDILNK